MVTVLVPHPTEVRSLLYYRSITVGEAILDIQGGLGKRDKIILRQL